MTPQFNIRFSVNRVTEELNLILTDTSDYSGVTTYYGFYKIIYPDGVFIENTDENNPDFENGVAVFTIPLKGGKIIEGEYSITQKTYTNIGDDQLEKIFTLSFADPSLIMSDNSNLAEPSVSFMDITEYVNAGYNPSVTRLIECTFPETSASSATVTTTANEIFMLDGGKTYEGVYKPKLTATALFTADDHEVQWVSAKSFEFDIRSFIAINELITLIDKVKQRLDNSQGNIRDLMDDYFMVTSLYTQIVANWGYGLVTKELTEIKQIYEDIHILYSSIIKGSGTLDYPEISAGGEQTLTVTVTGVSVSRGDSVLLGWSNSLETGLVVKQSWVSADDTVSITLMNVTGSPINPVSIDVYITCFTTN